MKNLPCFWELGQEWMAVGFQEFQYPPTLAGRRFSGREYDSFQMGGYADHDRPISAGSMKPSESMKTVILSGSEGSRNRSKIVCFAQNNVIAMEMMQMTPPVQNLEKILLTRFEFGSRFYETSCSHDI
jgi:hypothetical protein